MAQMRKVICIFLTFILVCVSGMVGCGSNKTTEEGKDVQKASSDTDVTDTKEKEEIQVSAAPTEPAVTSAAEVVTKKKVYLVITNKDDYVVSMRDNFVKELEVQGFVEGDNFEISETNLEGDFTKCPQIIEEIKTLKPDLVFAECSNGNIVTNFVKPFAEAKLNIPLVMALFADQGAAMDGSITGVKTFPSFLQEEAFKLLNRVAPINGKKAVFITNPGGGFSKESAESALKKNGIELKEFLETAIFEDFQDFVTRNVKDEEVGWILYGLTPWTKKKDGTFIQRSEFIEWEIANNKKPNISYWESAVRNFMLCGTAVDLDASAIQAGDIAIRILNGENPKDIPTEEPTKIKIVLNQQRATDLGVEFPADILGASRVYTDYKGTFIK